jgi:hypothetical protein
MLRRANGSGTKFTTITKITKRLGEFFVILVAFVIFVPERNSFQRLHPITVLLFQRKN